MLNNALQVANNAEGSTQSVESLLTNGINIFLFVVGIIAVFMIIIGGITYATSQGDAAKTKKGKDTILYGIIGLVVAMMAFMIVNFALGGLGLRT